MQDSNNLLSIEFSSDDSKLSSEELKELIRTQQRTRILPFPKTGKIHFTTIDRSTKLTQGEDVKTVYEISLALKDETTANYDSGDTIGILPSNDPAKVDKLLDRLNLRNESEKIYSLRISKETKKKNPAIPKHIPATGRIKDVFLYQVDIHSVPKKMFLKALIPYTTEKSEVERLQLICSPKGPKEYNELINGKSRTFLGLLEEFPSCNPTIETLFEFLPPLLPRPYTLSSSPLNGVLTVTFFVEKTPGICTGFLQKIITNSQDETEVAFYFRSSSNFHLPDDPNVPLIFIGTGTGISPLRAFIQHRHVQITKNNVKFNEAVLFFGCRYSDRDNLYKGEIETYLKSGALSGVKRAFSREVPGKKEYVQHKLIQCGEDISEIILKKNGQIYVCGDPKTMMVDVENCFKDIFVKFGGLDEEAALNYVADLKKQNRYLTDVWV